SLRLAVDGIPEGVDKKEIEQELLENEHVSEVHHVHIWAISTTETALTAHVVVDNLANWPQVSHQLKHELSEHGIAHATLEPETPYTHCADHEC
ncbi:MAG: cation transporter, partial [Paludibacteraceae bacterium]|nr:cation transporter [Paludibacteraceae bacterium]